MSVNPVTPAPTSKYTLAGHSEQQQQQVTIAGRVTFRRRLSSKLVRAAAAVQLSVEPLLVECGLRAMRSRLAGAAHLASAAQTLPTGLL